MTVSLTTICIRNVWIIDKQKSILCVEDAFLHVDDGATADFFKVKGLEHGGLDVQAHAMAREETAVGAEIAEKVNGVAYAVVHFK